MLQIGDEFRHKYSYTQADVDTFARVSGDTNPLHIDPAAGKASMFGRNIIHGFLGASVFTKIFGALWYADGHVYMSQNIKWLRPMFVDTEYEAVIKVKEIWTTGLTTWRQWLPQRYVRRRRASPGSRYLLARRIADRSKAGRRG